MSNAIRIGWRMRAVLLLARLLRLPTNPAGYKTGDLSNAWAYGFHCGARAISGQLDRKQAAHVLATLDSIQTDATEPEARKIAAIYADACEKALKAASDG